jgi:hypothetical protein
LPLLALELKVLLALTPGEKALSATVYRTGEVDSTHKYR